MGEGADGAQECSWLSTVRTRGSPGMEGLLRCFKEWTGGCPQHRNISSPSPPADTHMATCQVKCLSCSQRHTPGTGHMVLSQLTRVGAPGASGWTQVVCLAPVMSSEPG